MDDRGDNLWTASLYINNQLLSRGLLRDGQNIDFTAPCPGDGTMGRIMSVVNDLILRRDRDAEHRESLSTTLRTLRAESLRQTNDLQRLAQRHDDASRRAALADAAETSLRAQLRAAEAAMAKLRDDAARVRVQTAQARAACATEVRRRDRQMDGLKKAVAEAGRARGERKGSGITSIHVTGEIGGGEGGVGAGEMGVVGEDYDLRQETNAFLAELARGLSEENETLLALVRGASQKLREMSGFAGGAAVGPVDGHVVVVSAGCDELAREMEDILAHLRTILTNPSFVPIEEVVVREDEIGRLRDGWVKMEGRWKEAVHLLDGWRKRLALSGRSVNLEELKMGLRLSPVRVKDVEETAQLIGLGGLRLSTLREEDDAVDDSQALLQTPSPADSLHLIPAPEYIEPDDSDDESSIFEEIVDIHELDVEEPNVQILEQSMMLHSVDSPPLPPAPQSSALCESDSAGNRGGNESARGKKKAAGFTVIIEEDTVDVAKAAATIPLPRPAATKRAKSPPKQQTKPAGRGAAHDNVGPTSTTSHLSTASTDSVQLVKSNNPSPIPSAATRPTQSSSLKQRQQGGAAPARDPSPRQRPSSGRLASARTSAKATSTSTSAATTATGASSSTTRPDETPAPTKSSSSSSSSSNDMPPPPLPSKTPGTASGRASPIKPAGSSRLPLPRTLPAPPPQSPLTMASIAAKLAASEREADAARVRAKLKAARQARRPAATATANAAPPLPPSGGTSTIRTVEAAEAAGAGTGADDVDPVKRPLPAAGPEEEDELAAPAGGVDAQQQQPPRKREKRASKVASRRRSTLNPWELESLILGSVAGTPAR